MDPTHVSMSPSSTDQISVEFHVGGLVRCLEAFVATEHEAAARAGVHHVLAVVHAERNARARPTSESHTTYKRLEHSREREWVSEWVSE